MSSESVPVDETQLRRLHEATTPGPWYVCENLPDRVQSSAEEVWEDDDGTTYSDHPFVCQTDSAMEETQHPERDEANAAFIVAAHSAVPSLLDRLAAVEQERDQVRAGAETVEAIALKWACDHAGFDEILAAFGSGVRR